MRVAVHGLEGAVFAARRCVGLLRGTGDGAGHHGVDHLAVRPDLAADERDQHELRNALPQSPTPTEVPSRSVSISARTVGCCRMATAGLLGISVSSKVAVYPPPAAGSHKVLGYFRPENASRFGTEETPTIWFFRFD